MCDNYVVKEHPNRLRIMMINKKDKDKVASLLIQCLCSEKNIFYNINEGDNELSLIIDISMEQYYKKINCVYFPDFYRVIQVHENCSGIEHIGIVSEVSALFTDINVSIMYINTYNNNFILVKDKDYKKAIDALSKIGYKIQQFT
mgnify:CR=1 FL=1